MMARIDGPLRLDNRLFRLFLSLPEDPLPTFIGPTPSLCGRCRDHPRYGRWMHAFVKFYNPEIALEVGTNAGGTGVGIARAMVETGGGRLICVDNGGGRPRSFPDVAKKNLLSTGFDERRLELILEDSLTAVPRLSAVLKERVGVYLVDGAHTFDAALKDIENGLPMMKSGGFILVHDIDKKLDLGNESSIAHPYPVYEAFHSAARKYNLEWCVLKFIRKHLGVIKAN